MGIGWWWIRLSGVGEEYGLFRLIVVCVCVCVWNVVVMNVDEMDVDGIVVKSCGWMVW